MPRQKKETTTNKTKWPKITEGSHSIRTEYEDGHVEFITDWEKLERDVKQALRDYEDNKVA